MNQTGEVNFPEWTEYLRRMAEALERIDANIKEIAERMPADLGMTE